MAEQNTFTVEREDNEAGGRYVVHLAPDTEGEMTFRKAGGNTIIVDHTGVPRAFRGAGIAQLLMDRLIADLKADGTKVVPLCSYVAAQFQRHPEWSDLVAD